MSKNNIAFLRRRRNLTQIRLSEMIDLPVSTLNRIESGETAGFEKHRAKLAAALACAPEDLDIDALDLPTFPVTGTVKFKTFVKEVDASDQERVEAISGLPSTAQVIKIKGTHLIPYHGANELLYIDGNPEPNEKLFLDRECLVHLDTKKRGERLIAWVTKGTQAGRYILHPPGSALIVDAKILAAHPVLYTKPA